PTCSKTLTREHVISATVLREVFGDPVRNVISGESVGHKFLVDHEPVVRGVCEDCNNNRLSSYDAAGAGFIRQFLPGHDPTGMRIKFSREAIGWLIKTHLNYFRLIKDRETQVAYVVDQGIKDAYPRHVPWFNYRSVRMRSQRIVISDFRIKTSI